VGGVGQGLSEAFGRLAPQLPVCLSSLTDDQLVGFAQDAERMLRHAEALTVAVAREFDNRSDKSLGEESLARKLGAKTAAGALETVTRTTTEDARRRVSEAANLAKLPVFEAAVADGVLSRAQAAVIAAPILTTLHTADPASVDAVCGELVELARVIPATAVLDAANVFKAALDPDGVEPAEQTALEKRFVTLGRARNGLVKLTGLLTVEQAAVIRTLTDAYLNPRSGVTFAPAGAEPEDARPAVAMGPDLAPVDTRTIKQQRADIFGYVFAAQARATDAPSMGGAHPTILVTTTKETLETGRGAAWIDGEAEPISGKAAKRIAETGGFQEVDVTEAGAILNLGRTQRCASPAQRRALAVRDKGCVIPACPIPARWTEVHHIKPDRDGGPTDILNFTLLCWWHHVIIDDGPYELRMSDDGTPEVRWVFGSHASPWIRAVHEPQR
jgi:hypothetical protein